MLSIYLFEVFVPTMLAFNLMPGPAMLYCITQGSRHGRISGVWAAIGVETGTFVYVVSVACGLAFFLANSPITFHLIQQVGALYLIYLGIRELIPKRKESDDSYTKMPKKTWRIISEGFLINLLNPKVALFFIAFLPQFITDTHITKQLLILGLIFNASGFLINLSAGLLGHSVKIRYFNSFNTSSSIYWKCFFKGASACIFIGLGVWTLLLR